MVQTSISANGTPQTPSTHSFSHRQAADSKRSQGTGAKTKKQKERNSVDEEDDIFGSFQLC
ncbi:unnamed protein product [Onchocerca flexuosa]|uniref:Uncharacterized protein n=1 Tax=Onchocerca flexuosa TaxID=387005 RepID=A0A183I7R9_9BILA|nr:unnamed protein product [Onchocerca flexuosa]